ncbi:MAG: hypothetical protein ACYC4U_05245 [Pirellulaceae bacterium]
MADNPIQLHTADDLQFTTAETTNESAAVIQNCAACGQSITSTYFAIGDVIVCPNCSAQATSPPTGSKLGRLIKATVLGLGAGLIGALIWFAIRRLAHLEIGLIAILVGFMVGKAVRRGSGNQGGLAYQILAVVLTYCCIAANYMPDILEEVFANARQQPVATAGANAGGNAQAEAMANAPPAAEPAANQPPEELDGPVEIGQLIGAVAMLLIVVFAFALAAPFLAGAGNLIGLLIIGFALWEAWKFNTKQPLPISGPYQIAPRAV